MSRQGLKDGAIFLIGSGMQGRERLELDGGARLGKLIYQYEHFKDMFGFRPSIRPVTADVTVDELNQPIFMDQVIYCGKSELIKGHWPILAYETVTEAEKDLTTRLVANHLYRLDKPIRQASQEDRQVYRDQRIAGLQAVYTILNHLEDYFSKKIGGLQ